MSTEWKVVPSVCTDQMNLAGWKKRPFYSEETYAVIYAAMLDAAPTEGAPVLIDAGELAGLLEVANKIESMGKFYALSSFVRHDLSVYAKRIRKALAANGEKGT